MTDQEAQAEERVPQARKRGSYPYYATFIALYQALYAAFLVFYGKREDTLDKVSGLDVALLGLATLRLSKAISEDEITQVVRKPLAVETEGERRPQGRGLRYSLGKLILCPTCTGTWVAAFLTYALHLFPRHTRPFLAVMSASGISQMGDALLSLVYTDRDTLRERVR